MGKGNEVKLGKIVLAVAILAASTPAAAWNDRGHMTVAAAAWARMTPKARAEASRLLRLNPKYALWSQGVPAAERDQLFFVRAATWPDAIRDEYDDDGYDPVEPRASQNLGYAGDHTVHRYWHYKDIAFSPDGTATPPAPQINAVTRIELFSATLADPAASDDVKSFDLSWLLHLVGDIHQPLHAAERYTAQFRHGDEGGNGVSVCVMTANSCGQATKLHKFWDGAIGTSVNPGSAIAKAEDLAPADPVLAAQADPAIWAQESFDLAKRYAYAAPVGRGKKTYSLTATYRRNAGAQAEQRIALAGERLARLLNRLFD